MDLHGEAVNASAILSLTVFQTVVKILADCGIIGDKATQAGEVFHCIEGGAINADSNQ